MHLEDVQELNVLREIKQRRTFGGNLRYKLDNIPKFSNSASWEWRLTPMTYERAESLRKDCSFDEKTINNFARDAALTATGHYLKDWYRWFRHGWTNKSLDNEYGRV